MTNEEIVLKIKNGEDKFNALLWEQIKPFMCHYCNRYYMINEQACISAGIQLEDLIQESYFAMLDAVQAYNPDSGYKFMTFLNYPLKNILNSIVGYRTVSQKQSALNHAVSFDKPVKGTDNLKLGDIIQDYHNNIKDFENKLYNEQLHNDLIECMKSLSNEEYKALWFKYFENYSPADISRVLNIHIASVRATEYRGLRKMRTGKSYARLKPYEEDIISRYGYKSSYSLWNNTGYSSTEYTALKLMREM